MYCPKCAQERLSDQTRFCARCGYLLTGTAELIRNDGELPHTHDSDVPEPRSPRNRGIKQGIFMFLLTLLVFPVFAVIESSYNDYFNVTLVATAVLAAGGILRIAYAVMFEAAATNTTANSSPRPSLAATASVDPIAAPISGNWRNTEKLHAGLVAEGETRKLERDTGQ